MYTITILELILEKYEELQCTFNVAAFLHFYKFLSYKIKLIKKIFQIDFLYRCSVLPHVKNET